MARFFYYESCKGLLVEWKVQHGGWILKNLKYIFESSYIYFLFFRSYRYKNIFIYLFEIDSLFEYFQN